MAKNKPTIVNTTKSKFMMFKKTNKIVNSPNLNIDGTPIERISNFNCLGLTLDENLNWKQHNKKQLINVLEL